MPPVEECERGEIQHCCARAERVQPGEKATTDPAVRSPVVDPQRSEVEKGAVAPGSGTGGALRSYVALVASAARAGRLRVIGLLVLIIPADLLLIGGLLVVICLFLGVIARRLVSDRF